MVKIDLCRQLFGPITTAPLVRSEKNVQYSFHALLIYIQILLCLNICLGSVPTLWVGCQEGYPGSGKSSPKSPKGSLWYIWVTYANQGCVLSDSPTASLVIDVLRLQAQCCRTVFPFDWYKLALWTVKRLLKTLVRLWDHGALWLTVKLLPSKWPYLLNNTDIRMFTSMHWYFGQV